jgi:hypothetical protein
MKTTQHKHTVRFKQNQTRQTTENGWFNLLNFLRYYDRRDMTIELGIMRYGFESLVGKVNMIGENWTKQDINDVVFMLY